MREQLKLCRINRRDNPVGQEEDSRHYRHSLELRVTWYLQMILLRIILGMYQFQQMIQAHHRRYNLFKSGLYARGQPADGEDQLGGLREKVTLTNQDRVVWPVLSR